MTTGESNMGDSVRCDITVTIKCVRCFVCVLGDLAPGEVRDKKSVERFAQELYGISQRSVSSSILNLRVDMIRSNESK